LNTAVAGFFSRSKKSLPRAQAFIASRPKSMLARSICTSTVPVPVALS
jgi:hypothetical protein